MRLQALPGGVGPACDVQDDAGGTVALLLLRRFHDVEAVAVEEEGVVAEDAFQLRNGRMVGGNRLGRKLGEGLLNLRGVEPHRTLLVEGYRNRFCRGSAKLCLCLCGSTSCAISTEGWAMQLHRARGSYCGSLATSGRKA